MRGSRPNLYYNKEKGRPQRECSGREVYKVIEQLSPSDRKTVYDLAQFLRARHQTVVKRWRDIEAQEPDSEPLSPEESAQLRDPEFVFWDPESKHHGV